jgi:hypothetical protein
MEVFLDVLGFEGLYKISNLGNILSISRKVRHGRHKDSLKRVKQRVLRQSPAKGYMKVCLCDSNRNRKYRYTHRLVAEVFCIGNGPGKEVNHKDGDKLNNRASNLEWVTKSQNQRHAYDVLKRNYYKKTTKDQDESIKKMLASGMKQKDIAKIFGVSQAAISLRNIKFLKKGNKK